MRRTAMTKRLLGVLVLCLALTTLTGCYSEEPYADKKAQEGAEEQH